MGDNHTMRVREKNDLYTLMTISRFNVHALAEVICYWDDGSADNMFIKELDVFIVANGIGWKDMRQAFKDKDIITDNYNTTFFEPTTEEDKIRGFTL